MAETEEYKEWLASTPSNVAVIDCIIIQHPSFPKALRAANWSRNIKASYINLEGVKVRKRFIRARFDLSEPTVEDSLSQGTNLSVSSDDGKLYDAINNMTPEERSNPIKLYALQYLHTDLDNPLISYPYPAWTIGSFSANYKTYSVELTVPQLRVRRIGRYFTSREIPVLVYI